MSTGTTHICPQCGTRAPPGQVFCGNCGQRLITCPTCNATNLAWADFCHNCGKTLSSAVTSITSKQPQPNNRLPAVNVRIVDTSTSNVDDRGPKHVERMRNCVSCKKAIGADETFCSYCGAEQIVVKELQDPLDLHTVRVADKMVNIILEAKEHEEYSTIDELATLIGTVALGEGKPQDAQELSFQDQLRLLTLVFEFTRDKITYKGETFGDYVRWPWQTLKTGGDCDCKVVLLASLLASLAYRRMYLLLLPSGTYIDAASNKEKHLQGHALLEVDLTDKERRVPVRLDPSCEDCDVDEVSGSMEPFLQNFYRIPIMP